MSKNWIKGAISNPGALRKTLGAEPGKRLITSCFVAGGALAFFLFLFVVFGLSQVPR